MPTWERAAIEQAMQDHRQQAVLGQYVYQWRWLAGIGGLHCVRQVAPTSKRARDELVASARLALAHTAVCPNCMRSVPFYPADNPLSRCPQGCWRRLHNTMEWGNWYSARLGYRFVLESTRILAWEKRPPYTLAQAKEAQFDSSSSSEEEAGRGKWGETPGMDSRRHFRRYHFYCRGVRCRLEEGRLEDAESSRPLDEQWHARHAQDRAPSTGKESPGRHAKELEHPTGTPHALWQSEECGFVAAIGGMRGMAQLVETSNTVCQALLSFGRARLEHTTTCPHCECSYPWAAGEYCRFDTHRLRHTLEWMVPPCTRGSLRYMLHTYDVLENEGVPPYQQEDTAREWFGQHSDDSEHTDM